MRKETALPEQTKAVNKSLAFSSEFQKPLHWHADYSETVAKHVPYLQPANLGQSLTTLKSNISTPSVLPNVF